MKSILGRDVFMFTKNDLVQCRIKGKKVICIIDIINGCFKLRDLDTNNVYPIGRKKIILLGNQLSFAF